MLAWHLAIKSLLNRRLATLLTLASVTLSVALLTLVERVRLAARDSFASTISQTDLIVGPRGGSMQLLLYSVFHLGNATNELSFASYKMLQALPDVAWTIPLSLGDSHKGFRVVGTSADFYAHYHYRRDQSVAFAAGQAPQRMFDVALGSAVAAQLHYHLGDRLTLAHGTAEVSFQQHADKPFTVRGILAPTGTPLDRSLYITLAGNEAIHADWEDGAPPAAGHAKAAADLEKQDLPIDAVTAVLVGAKSRLETLRLQRQLNDYKPEALTAIIPGVALGELWDVVAYGEDGLRIVSACVVIVGLLGMVVSIYNSLSERRREMAILRAVGAGPGLIAGLMILESLLLTTGGAALGVALMYGLLALLQPWIVAEFGLYLPVGALSTVEWLYLAGIFVLGLALGGLPAWRAYRNTLADGLTIRI